MGLTKSSTGICSVDFSNIAKKQCTSDRVIALAGNPNVGKSTVFNSLTGMRQHTGNWPGKTVANAQGYCTSRKKSYVLVDIPGTYSLMAHSAEEEIARNFLCFGEADAIVVVCDATCLERNLNLALQTLEISDKVIVCINLMDEAKRKKINIDLDALSNSLGVPVIGTVARKKSSLDALLDTLDRVTEPNYSAKPIQIGYIKPIEDALGILSPALSEFLESCPKEISPRWLGIRLLCHDEALLREAACFLGKDPSASSSVLSALTLAEEQLAKHGIDKSNISDKIVSCIVLTAEGICNSSVSFENKKYNSFDRRADKLLTGRLAGYPVMIALLLFVFWLTIVGANYPSQLLSSLLFGVQNKLTQFFEYISAPEWLHGILVLGIYRVLAWVISVMLPPMAIFFPLFTLLEDSGYLPRIAYNLDRVFSRCHACGKQALTMCMGFGCNAAGIVGCRIIDSPRERLIAMLTNTFVPCNGRFPSIIAIISMFFIGAKTGILGSLLSAVCLTAVILLGIFMTFLTSAILSKTILKGVPSSFTLELPPYRVPQFGKVIVRSVFDRTLFVLGRAVCIAAPAGLIIYLTANIHINGVSILNCAASMLDPLGRLLGMDGVILIAFILGLPANEIVVPIIIMAYMSQGVITEIPDTHLLKSILVSNGWTATTAVCTILFSLFHWPCSTTLLSIRKESGSTKWMLAAFAIPTAAGMVICGITAAIMRMFV